MGTRGFIGFVDTDGRETIAYNHFDSYPSGIGVEVLEFARHNVDTDNLAEVDRLAKNLKHVSDRVPPTQADMLALEPYANGRVSTGRPTDWYCLLRETQGNPVAILECGYAEHDSNWPLDSLFCEWGYLVDLQNNTFEVYEGFQKTPPQYGRWAGKSPLPRYEYDTVEYHAVERVAVFSLKDLPSKSIFLALEGD